MNLPAEAMEMEAPIRIHRVALRQDSGGAGDIPRRPRRGARIRGPRRRGVVLASRRAPLLQRRPGLDGGGGGRQAHSVIRRADGGEEVIPSKIGTTLGKGDRLVIETAGGGGYGDPRRGPPSRCARMCATAR